MLKHAILATVMAAFAKDALSADRISYPYPGVMHVHRIEPGIDAHVVTIDLSSAAGVVATRPNDRWLPPSQFARQYDAQIAINANFFDDSTCGLAVGDGRVWRDAYAEHCNASMAFGPRADGWRVALFDSEGYTRLNPIPWATQIVTGWPILLWHGAQYFDEHEPNGMYRVHPRTAVGVTGDAATLVIAVVDGRRAGAPGVTSVELVPLLESFGVSDAINFDGGGSSALYIASEGGVVNQPSDGGERPVMNHLGIRLAGYRPELL